MTTKKKNKIRITYNAPVTLTFAIISAIILLISTLTGGKLISFLFTCPGNFNCTDHPFGITNPIDYIRLILHIFGHADWNHFISNMAFIVLLGPVVEEKYGSPLLILMMATTSLVTGVLNVCFCPVQLLGSSDIAFMIILLASFNSINKNEIPLSFIFILVLYIGREIAGSGLQQNISTLAHIAGGICGSLFAFLAKPKPKAVKSTKSEEIEVYTPPARKNKKDVSNSDETVVGSIEL